MKNINSDESELISVYKELGVVKNELAFRATRKENGAAKLGITNKELAFQNEE